MNNDKTRKKLMDSMRKTKVGAKSNKAEEDAAESQKNELITESSMTNKQQTDKAVAVKKQVTPRHSVNSQFHIDPYQSGNRVWPD